MRSFWTFGSGALTLKILGKATSINVRKVLWCCTELGLAFEREDWGSGTAGATDAPEFLALNPNAMVPVLVDGDFTLWESNAICRYLASRDGPTSLLPSAPRERADIERWMDWQISELNPAWRHAFMALVRHSPRHADAAAIADSLREWNRLMAILDAQLERTGAYVTGADFTLADIVLGLSTHRWYLTPQDARPALPAVAAYYERLSTRPAFLAHGRNGTP